MAIPNVYSLIIDGGIEQGIEIGDRFKIIKKGVQITHPITKKVVGYIGEAKETVRVSEVYDKLCVCESIASSLASQQIQSLALSMSAMMSAMNGLTMTQQSLNVNENQVGLEGSVDNAPISILDKAVLYKRVEVLDEQGQDEYFNSEN